MSVIDYDAVVIGGGMSGLMAGIHLLEQGYTVAVVSRGDPAVCLSTGCIDVCGTGMDPLAGVDALPDEHPYHVTGKEKIRAALDKFSDIMTDVRLPYAGRAEENRAIITPLGTTKLTCLVPRTMETAPRKPDEYIHVVSFNGLKDFYPSYITARRKNTGFSLFDAGVTTTMGIAARFEDRAFLKEFIAWLKGLEIPDGKLAFPAVMGLEHPLSIMQEIQSQVERWGFEIPTLPPSLPGIRLFKGLKRSFQGKGGDVYWGSPIASVERSGKHIEAVTIETKGRSTRVNGRAFILATGSFVSGGLFALRDEIQETVFGLSVASPGPRDDWFNRDFFTPGHAVERAGIRVGKDFRPSEDSLENLFVCGSIISGSEVMKYGCGHGLALTTGLAAAESCAEVLK
ncbi:MAG: anaerobic glycerol-3-phosphate dehydrogenase subunit B [Syntrophaceae bacterium]